MFNRITLARVLNRLDDLLIAAAAAKISCQIVSDLLLRGLWTLVEQRFGRKNKTGGAVAALKRSEIHKRLLQRMHRILFTQPFDGQDFTAINIQGQHRAGAHRFAVYEQSARAADLNIAAKLGAREPKLITDHVEKRRTRLDFDVTLKAIDEE